MRAVFLSVAVVCGFATVPAGAASALFARGYAVLPEPQQVTLLPGDFTFGTNWRLNDATNGKGANAVRNLTEQLKNRYHWAAANPAATSVVKLAIEPGTINPGASQDKDRAAITAQAYRIDLNPNQINLVANTEAGLFYAVQTLVQLLNTTSGEAKLPQGTIVDWPDLELRQMYWDDAHHLETVTELKRAIRQASFFKINGFVMKLEGHFEYRSAPALVEPQALSPSELQELTDFGLQHFVQVIPYLDAPAHIAFILKHPEYQSLRAFPDSNYELCTTNPESLKLLRGMYDDLLAANRGVKYFYLSTDEAYYVGMADHSGCREAGRAKELGSRGKLLAEFVTAAANYLHDHGRTVVFWGEYPLKVEDIASLPVHLINGETNGEPNDSAYKQHGNRQSLYGAIEGEELLFPQYYLLPAQELLHPLHETERRSTDSIDKVITDPARSHSDLYGTVIAGWGDMGLHPETFWLGYATVTAAGWNPSPLHTAEWAASFHSLFYGRNVTAMARTYQLLSYQTQVYTDTWERKDSTNRRPIWGNSEKIFTPPQPAHDATISLPPPPEADLRKQDHWRADNQPRLQLAAKFLPANEEVFDLLHGNVLNADFNRYNLEVLLSVADLCRQNLRFFGYLEQMDRDLSSASEAASAGSAKNAVAALDRALTAVHSIRRERNQAFHSVSEIWSKSWLPRVPEANGRKFLHEVDDVKDHLPDRTVDMTYLIYRELQLPFDDWFQRTQDVRNQYARAHSLPEQKDVLNWGSLQ